MAGEGSRFKSKGFERPKPFIDVNGKPMIERVIENLNITDARFILIARKEHIEKEKKITEYIMSKYNIQIVLVDKLTEGTDCTVLYARNYINTNEPLLIANSDQIVDIDLNDFVRDCINRDLDGSILTFKDKYKNPKWSFAKVDESGLVVEVKEKEVISDYATVGIYFYSKGKDFVDSSIDMIVRNDRVNNEFYVCPTYNYAIKNGKKIGIFDIDFLNMHGLGTPEDLKQYIEVIK
jgi:NDP-sugar pyrophosphorylase family protein